MRDDKKKIVLTFPLGKPAVIFDLFTAGLLMLAGIVEIILLAGSSLLYAFCGAAISLSMMPHVYFLLFKRRKMKVTVYEEKRVICFEHLLVMSKKRFLPLRPERYECGLQEILKVRVREAEMLRFVFVTEMGDILVTNRADNFAGLRDWVRENLADKIEYKMFEWL